MIEKFIEDSQWFADQFNTANIEKGQFTRAAEIGLDRLSDIQSSCKDDHARNEISAVIDLFELLILGQKNSLAIDEDAHLRYEQHLLKQFKEKTKKTDLPAS